MRSTHTSPRYIPMCSIRPMAMKAAAAIAWAIPAHAQAGWVATSTSAFPLDGASQVAHLSETETVSVVVALRLRNRNELDRSVSAPGPLGGRAPLAPGKMNDYLPTASGAKAVARYLATAGFHDIHISDNRLLVSAKGSASAVMAAFNTAEVHVHRNGHDGIANVSAAQVPVSLGGTVLSVLGLQTVEQMHVQSHLGGASGCGSSAPCGATPEAASGLSPLVFPGVYGATNLPIASKTGVGIIAVGDLTQVIADLKTFETSNGLPTVPTQIKLVGANGPALQTAEFQLDSQVIQATSGGLVAKLTFYDTATLQDFDLVSAYNAAEQDLSSKIVNVSIGGCELVAQSDGTAAAADQIFELALAQGQTFSFASGDSGANTCTPNKPGQSYPAASPYVIAVGGTTLTVTNGRYGGEVAWPDGGGGPSQIEGKPFWQNNVVPGSMRGVPDIAFDAGTGVTITVNGAATSTPVRGTSLASPIFVALFARLQTAANNTLPFPVQWIYHFGAGRRPAAFHDVTSGSNGAYQATVGWDFTTGFGSLNAAGVQPGLAVLPLAPIIAFLLGN